MKFAVISYQRTGSTFFVSKLNTIQGVVCHSELFNNGFHSFENSIFDPELFLELSLFDKLTGRSQAEKLFKFKNKEPLRFLHHIFSYRDEPTGFKIFPGQNKSVLHHILKDRSVKKIVLIRENLVRSFISREIALKTGEWGKYNKNDVSLVKISMDVDRFLDYADSVKGRFKQIESILTDSEQPYLKCTYEQISKRFPLEEVCSFLNIPKPDQLPEIDQVRQNPFILSEMIINFKDVKRRLDGTGYSRFLEDSDKE